MQMIARQCVLACFSFTLSRMPLNCDSYWSVMTYIVVTDQ